MKVSAPPARWRRMRNLEIDGTADGTQMPTSAGESWYVAVLVFQAEIEGPWSDPSVDVQHRLIRAANHEQAYARAIDLGQQSQHSYQNANGETCTWSFQGLADLQDVVEANLEHGVEIYGFIEDGAADDYVVEKDQLSVFLGRKHG